MKHKHPYHHYFFFDVDPEFHQLTTLERTKAKESLEKVLRGKRSLSITPYATLGFKTNTTFMLWCRGKTPAHAGDLLRDVRRSLFGRYLTLTHTYFGIVRTSPYSGRAGKPEQIMQNFNDRLPYLVLYPFTKTSDWYAMSFENRRTMMGQHIKIGVGFEKIRQCLLYSAGVDDHEFLVSYEMNTLEEFQDLIMAMRETLAREYTKNDTPIFTCLHKPLDELIQWI